MVTHRAGGRRQGELTDVPVIPAQRLRCKRKSRRAGICGEGRRVRQVPDSLAPARRPGLGFRDDG